MTRRLAGVEFLGRVSDAEKAQLFRTADVFVSPATGRESFGIVLLEAMAAGAPIVASDIHGYKGVVRRGEQGLLVPPGDPRELAAAIGRLVIDDELRGRDERQRASPGPRAFSWERVTDRVEAYYGFVIRRLRRPGRPAAGLQRRGPAVAAGRAAAGGRRPWTPTAIARVPVA